MLQGEYKKKTRDSDSIMWGLRREVQGTKAEMGIMVGQGRRMLSTNSVRAYGPVDWGSKGKEHRRERTICT